MSEYLVLARKYRSTTFDEVVGQEPIAQTLKNAIASGRVAHAYLFTGTRGVGKTTMARILAKALNCLKSDGPTAKPCNKCEACKAIARGEDLDVVEIDGASNRGIDEIRELRANAIFRPARCRYKIYYIDEVHMLTKEAFNALLKTLEEPPEHVKFIFATTESEKVPATILSRCQRFDFRNIPTRLIAEHLKALCKAEKVKAEDDALFRVARAASGSMRDALSLLDQLLAGGEQVTDAEVVRILGTPADERMIALVNAIADGNSSAALGELNAVLESGVTLPTAAMALGDVFRNLMIVAACGGKSDLVELPETQRQTVAELAKRFSTPVLVQAVGICQTLGRNLRGSSVGRALVEAAIIRLAEADKFVDPASLVQRLESLASGNAPAAGQKKNFLTGSDKAPCVSMGSSTADPRLTAGASSGTMDTSPAAIAIQWNAAWLSGHWQLVIEALGHRRQMQAAGLLRPAEVLALENSTLKLGFDAAHENLLARWEGSTAKAVDAALSELAGQPIHCELVATGKKPAGHAAAAAVQPHKALSTAEKGEILRDAAVRAVLGSFGGELVDMRLVTPPPPAVDEAAEEGK